MTIRELQTVFFGSVLILGRILKDEATVAFPELYRGRLSNLSEMDHSELFDRQILVITNTRGSTLQNSIPFLTITLDD